MPPRDPGTYPPSPPPPAPSYRGGWRGDDLLTPFAIGALGALMVYCVIAGAAGSHDAANLSHCPPAVMVTR